MKMLLGAGRFAGSVLVTALAAALPCSAAVVTNVTIVDNAFEPPSVTIKVNDQVRWNWNSTLLHTTTSDTGLWDSGSHTGTTFTYTTNVFTSAGTYPYHCSNHPLIMLAGVTVEAGNTPPNVDINAPTNGASFVAPWTGTIQVTDSASGGTVAQVDFYANTTLLGTVSNPPNNASFTVTNLAAGDYTLSAVATDSSGATNASGGVVIHVITPSPVMLSSMSWSAPTTFQFNYTADPGLTYFIQRGADLTSWLMLATNTAVSNPMPFTDDAAAGQLNFYRVQLAPNP